MHGVHLTGEQFQAAPQVPLFSKQVLFVADDLPILVLQGPDEMFGLIEQPERRVPGAVGADGHDVLQPLQAVPQVSSAVLFQLVVSGSEGKNKNE